MVRTLTELEGYQIEATDGLVGRVAGVYFDDARWSVRYLVVNTGTWLDAREVLLSPSALETSDALTRTLTARLTKKQVASSPSTELDKPVSRQHESELAEHYGWPLEADGPEDMGDHHLRSSREIVGYQLRTTDDTFGHVEDLVIDDDGWLVRYLAVKATSWWPGGHVLISPRWIDAIRWPERFVDLRATRDVVKRSPTWTPTYPITPEYEHDLLEYYRGRLAWSLDARSNEAPLHPKRPSS